MSRLGKRNRREVRNRMKTRRLLFLGLWILSLAAITNYGGAVSYGFFFGMTMIPVVSLVYMICVYSRFKIYQEIGSRSMVCGQPEKYLFVLQNESFFSFTSVSVRLFSDFSYVEEMPGDVEYELLPGDRFSFETRIVCRYRGEYEVGVKEVVVTDFFRLFRLRYHNPGTVKALVSPKVAPLTELKSIGEFQTLLRREILGGTEMDILVRDYREGDPPRQIHWKQAAREQKLKTRLRIGEEKEGIALFCDMKRYGWEREQYLPLENKMLEVLLALGFFFAGKDAGFSVYYSQNVLVKKQVQGMKDFDAFYREMDEAVFREDEDLYGTLDQAMSGGNLWRSKLVFFVLHDLDEQILEMTKRLAAEGTMVVIYAVTDSGQEQYVRQSSERRKIVAVPIETELEGVL